MCESAAVEFEMWGRSSCVGTKHVEVREEEVAMFAPDSVRIRASESVKCTFLLIVSSCSACGVCSQDVGCPRAVNMSSARPRLCLTDGSCRSACITTGHCRCGDAGSRASRCELFEFLPTFGSAGRFIDVPKRTRCPFPVSGMPRELQRIVRS